ncbi:peptidyl-Lys metalloendopeptidase [Ramicandelaber brevisporus]|nr:peptidyl-Lys metalloendopeptidase [Ramicandelaber brevisporus]
MRFFQLASYMAMVVATATISLVSYTQAAQFVGCTADQQNQINNAVVAATNYVGNAYNYMVNPPSDSTDERYITWFGAEENQRRAFVTSVLNNLNNNDFTTFTYDCITCTNPTLLAYVYPDQFGIMYLCAIFWNINATGANSQGGTIVSQASQFLNNGGTQNHEYGEDDCQELARTKPQDAITNAENYEFFAENDPPLN